MLHFHIKTVEIRQKSCIISHSCISTSFFLPSLWYNHFNISALKINNFHKTTFICQRERLFTVRDPNISALLSGKTHLDEVCHHGNNISGKIHKSVHWTKCTMVTILSHMSSMYYIYNDYTVDIISLLYTVPTQLTPGFVPMSLWVQNSKATTANC